MFRSSRLSLEDIDESESEDTRRTRRNDYSPYEESQLIKYGNRAISKYSVLDCESLVLSVTDDSKSLRSLFPNRKTENLLRKARQLLKLPHSSK